MTLLASSSCFCLMIVALVLFAFFITVVVVVALAHTSSSSFMQTSLLFRSIAFSLVFFSFSTFFCTLFNPFFPFRCHWDLNRYVCRLFQPFCMFSSHFGIEQSILSIITTSHYASFVGTFIPSPARRCCFFCLFSTDLAHLKNFRSCHKLIALPLAQFISLLFRAFQLAFSIDRFLPTYSRHANFVRGQFKTSHLSEDKCARRNQFHFGSVSLVHAALRWPSCVCVCVYSKLVSGIITALLLCVTRFTRRINNDLMSIIANYY